MKGTGGHKRLFGIFNSVDIVIILLVIVMAIGGYLFLRGRSAAETAGGVKTIQYTVEGQNIVSSAAAYPKVGDKAYNSSTSAYLGIVKDIRVEDQMKVDYNPQKGAYDKHAVTGFKTVYITIEGEGYDNDQNVVVNDNVVKVGQELNVKGKGYAMGGYIVGIHLDGSEQQPAETETDPAGNTPDETEPEDVQNGPTPDAPQPDGSNSENQ